MLLAADADVDVVAAVVLVDVTVVAAARKGTKDNTGSKGGGLLVVLL